jgi:hypothetical protein
MSTEQRVVEVDHDSGHLEILALTQTGSWDAILTLNPNAAEVVGRYRTPLLLRFGYSQDFQSDIPQAESDKRGVMPHDSLPVQS